MPFQHDVDPPTLYDGLRRSFVDLVMGLDPEQRATRVPATPGWSVVDTLAHVVGINADLNNLRFGDVTPDEWTARQVAARRGRSVEELATEWDAEAPKFIEGIRAFGYPFGAHYVGDLLHHVADVRHALGLPAPADDETLLVATDFYLESLDEALRSEEVGSVVIHTGGETFTTGSGNEVAQLRAPRYEVFRTLGGRRSERQIRNLDWTGDVERILPVVSRYPLPGQDIVERS